MRRPGKVRVVSVCTDPQLRRLRDDVLMTAGFEVISPRSVADAVAGLGASEPDVLLLGHTLSEHEAEQLITCARNVRPQAKILQLTLVYQNSGAPQPDAQVESLSGPEALISAIRNFAPSEDTRFKVTTGGKRHRPQSFSATERRGRA